MSSYCINWLLLLSLMAYSVSSTSDALFAKTHVLIYNDIGTGTQLAVHCKSKDDDLGLYVLVYRQSYEFSFHRDFFLKTLFFCNMQWNGTVYRFDIYNQKRDDYRCGDRCEWNVHGDGACMLNPQTSKFDICYGWNT
ncbi:hypothetical protein V6N11_020590 [Hibiscus sabdariffa]|uniref:S-protein homolog n=1 Tax=Hibiscus sabdariffa TaxID=183260 RepID=A0ABR2Q975_9ROSI